MKNWSVGCVISVHGDQVLTTTASGAGGRHVFPTVAQALGMPVALEIQERYNIAVPEVAGFITINGVAGSSQMLNLRKFKKIVKNDCLVGNPLYTVSNEVNPAQESTTAQNM